MSYVAAVRERYNRERLPMLTSQKVIDAINEKIGYEFSAELQYYAIAAHFAAEALPQLSQHFFKPLQSVLIHHKRLMMRQRKKPEVSLYTFASAPAAP